MDIVGLTGPRVKIRHRDMLNETKFDITLARELKKTIGTGRNGGKLNPMLRGCTNLTFHQPPLRIMIMPMGLKNCAKSWPPPMNDSHGHTMVFILVTNLNAGWLPSARNMTDMRCPELLGIQFLAACLWALIQVAINE
ncbi:hypothetical protein N7493_003525 [Penicillium malachiteum]|uniref:Uncharacterized protein n=1 Tax=Penicillium malachiteum TaxID=1324776 RepID=A0AAD6HQ59_9EURO|nr:hypothetical protein N7493_003525 [Penicillium malachiteum]